MCGICGKVTFHDRSPPHRDDMLGMRDSLTHRGPDDAGLYSKDNVQLAHRRLSIIDVEGSAQPLSNEDDTLWIVYNGEIYNFQDLRDDLIRRGHVFRTSGDTEVLVHLYEEYGKECVTKVRGMFSLAIWDEKRKELFLARDRFGIKPLYYFADDSVFVFASEMKAILSDRHCRARKSVDEACVDPFFACLYVPAPRTMFKGIKKLLPGHWMTVSSDGAIKTQRYWDITFGTSPLRMDQTEVCAELYSLLEESVRLRMISDVPLGAFLSGGMDSSTVVAIMAGLSSRPLKTFSIGFAEDAYNEAADAREIANRFSTDHTEVILEADDIMAEMPSLMRHFDEPFADSSLLPTYLVSRVARRDVTVVLSGDGGDEIFGGYPWWQKRPSYQAALFRLPRTARRLISRTASRTRLPMPKRYLMSHLDTSYETYLFEAKAVIGQERRTEIYSDEFRARLDGSGRYPTDPSALRKRGDQGWTDKLMEYDLKTYIPNDILPKVDMMSMLCSLEARVPLLDHKLVEFAAQIPAQMKFRGGESKFVLKKTMEDTLPRRILHKKKQGFSIPLASWLRTKMKDQVLDALFNTNDHGFFDKKNVEKAVNDFLGGNDARKEQVWELFTFEVWYSNHFAS